MSTPQTADAFAALAGDVFRRLSAERQQQLTRLLFDLGAEATNNVQALTGTYLTPAVQRRPLPAGWRMIAGGRR